MCRTFRRETGFDFFVDTIELPYRVWSGILVERSRAIWIARELHRFARRRGGRGEGRDVFFHSSWTVFTGAPIHTQDEGSVRRRKIQEQALAELLESSLDLLDGFLRSLTRSHIRRHIDHSLLVLRELGFEHGNGGIFVCLRFHGFLRYACCKHSTVAGVSG